MSRPEIVVITPRQRNIEELASQIVEERPGTTTKKALLLASLVIDELDKLEQDWDMRSALAYALQPRRTRTA